MTKGGMLYAYFMGWPDGGSVKIRSLAGANVEGVELLGHGKVEFTQEADGLKVCVTGYETMRVRLWVKGDGAGDRVIVENRPDDRERWSSAGWKPFGG